MDLLWNWWNKKYISWGDREKRIMTVFVIFSLMLSCFKKVSALFGMQLKQSSKRTSSIYEILNIRLQSLCCQSSIKNSFQYKVHTEQNYSSPTSFTKEAWFHLPVPSLWGEPTLLCNQVWVCSSNRRFQQFLYKLMSEKANSTVGQIKEINAMTAETGDCTSDFWNFAGECNPIQTAVYDQGCLSGFSDNQSVAEIWMYWQNI